MSRNNNSTATFDESTSLLRPPLGSSSPLDHTSGDDTCDDPYGGGGSSEGVSGTTFELMKGSSKTEGQASQKRDKVYNALIALLVLLSFSLGVALAVRSSGRTRGRFTGPYVLRSYQTPEDLLESYDFYAGPDSAGSAGHVMYVNETLGRDLGIIKESGDGLYLGSKPVDGTLASIRLEGRSRYSNGLFLLSLTHAPTGCGVWPAWWLTDEEAWPKNGEIDIFETVNVQSRAKTAMHSTKGCEVGQAPREMFTGEWDTAYGIPDKKTGMPKQTGKDATNCYVYDPDQWLNQGCVVESQEEGTVGQVRELPSRR